MDTAARPELRASLLRSLRSGALGVLALFVVTRTLLALALLAGARAKGVTLPDALLGWDAEWYLKVMTNGYATTLPPGDWNAAQVNVAFFPALPLLGRGVHALLGGDPRTSAIVVGLLTGLLGSLGVWAALRHWVGDQRALLATFLFLTFPGAAVLGTFYTEGLFLAALGLLLHAGWSERWEVAGLAAVVAGLARSSAVIVVPVAVVLAWPHLRGRVWRAAWLPVGAGIGAAAYHLFLWARFGSPTVWFDVLRRGWHVGLTVRVPVLERLRNAMAGWTIAWLWLFAIVVLLLALLLLVRWRPGPLAWTLVASSALPVVLSTSMFSATRYLATALPIFAAPVRTLPRSAVVAISLAWFAVALWFAWATVAVVPTVP